MQHEPSADGRRPPSAILTWSKSGADLVSHRSQALADYWAGLAGARQPDEAMAVQVPYWAHWVEDSAAAAAAALSPFAPPNNGAASH